MTELPLHKPATTRPYFLEVRHHSQEKLERFDHATPHRHDSHEIILLTSGQMHQKIDGEESTIKSGDLCLIAKGQVHAVTNMQDVSMWVLFFAEENLGEDISLLVLSLFNLQAEHIFNLSQNEQFFMMSLFQAMNILDEEDNDSHLKAELFQHYLSTILLRIERLRQQTLGERNPKKLERYAKVQQFLALLQIHYKEHHGVKFYADTLGLTRRKLATLCQDVIGKRAKDVIAERLNLEARRLLRFQNLSAKEVAYQLGFDEPSYFARFFRKLNGVSPSQFN